MTVVSKFVTYCICIVCILYLNTDRPTEFSEEHIYVCEWKYKKGDGENSIRKLSKGFKNVAITNQVCDDELLYFPKKVSIKRVSNFFIYTYCNHVITM